MGIIQGMGTLGSAFGVLIIGFTLDASKTYENFYFVNNWIYGMWLEISIVITLACLPLSYLAYRDTIMIRAIRTSIKIISRNL